MAKFISGVHKRFVRMARRKSKPKNVEKYVEKYLEDFDYEPRYHNHYYQRLQHGLLECYSNRYLNPKNDQEKE
jgi:hypothetical protein